MCRRDCKRMLYLLELELQAIVSLLMKALGTQSGSSRRILQQVCLAPKASLQPLFPCHNICYRHCFDRLNFHLIAQWRVWKQLVNSSEKHLIHE